MKKEIDYYGTEDNYIHLKFGNARKCFNFTEEFRNKYPEFTESYEYYWDNTPNKIEDNNFYSAYDVVETARALKLPANLFYFNFTDTPATSYEEIEEYLNNN